MSEHPTEPRKPPAADQDKPDTPDKYRNEKARWKDHDMPDTDPAHNHADPQDYERPPPG